MKFSRTHAIKCPQCGSTKHKNLAKNQYQCSNCDTQYVLENNEYIVNHYHHHIPAKTHPANPKAIAVAIIVPLVLVGMLLVATIWNNAKQDVTTGEVWQRYDSYFLETDAKQAVVVRVGQMKEYGKDDANSDQKIKAVFYDAISDERLKVVELPLELKRFTRVEFKRFTDGTLYFIVEEKHLGRIGANSLTAELLPWQAFKQHPKLSGSGVAEANFERDMNNDGFRLVTNEGETVYYYPSQDLLLSQNEYREFKPESTVPMTVQTAYSFVEDGRADSLSDKYRLIQYRYQHQSGYPIQTPSFEYNDAGQLEEQKWSKERSQTLDFTELTPNRNYFSPQLLDFNQQELMIGYKLTPAQDTLYTIQVLNAQNGEVKWTYQVEDDSMMYYPSSGQIVSKGYFVDFAREAVLFDQQGKVIREK